MSWILSDAARLELAEMLDEWVKDRDQARDLGDHTEAQSLTECIDELDDWRRRNITV